MSGAVDPVGYIRKSYGAYLIELTADGTEDVPAHELFAAASSLKRAKAVLREMATGFGCSRLRWRNDGSGAVLLGEAPEWGG